jgi:hypothetical protein
VTANGRMGEDWIAAKERKEHKNNREWTRRDTKKTKKKISRKADLERNRVNAGC